MKNVTVTMEDSVADWARMEAARRNTSVSRLIGEMLAEKMQRTDRYQRAMREALKFQPVQFTGPFLTRDQIYAERLDRFR
ncbi:MAG TPA: CopG family transcriptional regulator [Rubrivivax sp.]|nr:CopG family transcriptional regulator [Rubrivivax sp.]